MSLYALPKEEIVFPKVMMKSMIKREKYGRDHFQSKIGGSFSAVLFHNLSFSILKVRCYFWWGLLILALASKMASEEVAVIVNHFTAETTLDPELETGLAFSISTTCGVNSLYRIPFFLKYLEIFLGLDFFYLLD